MLKTASVSFLSLSLFLVSTVVANAGWQNGNGGSVPAGAMPAGQESNGEKLYICRANYNGGVHSGKVRRAFGGCNISFGGKEVKVNPYSVYMPSRWVPASGGSVPNGAVSGGNEASGERLYICRASFSGGIHPGKVRQAFGGCNIGYSGGEHKVGSYEVLVD